MAKECALEIVRKLHTDGDLRKHGLEMLQADRTDDILVALKQADIQADAQDWKVALDAYWIVDKLLGEEDHEAASQPHHANPSPADLPDSEFERR
jgi:hypothetical protein